MVLERQKSFIKPGRLLYSWGLWRVADFVCPSKGIEIFNLREKTIYFLIDNSPKINDFIDYYERDSQLSRLALLSVDFYRWTDRKVSKQPYFKHPFYTDYLCFEMLDERNEIVNTESDKRVFLGAALFIA